ncbi:hypothetical protein SLS63_006233 [Diaporthe eres]|uniref:Uncharacterized protein n=1 Tax=Diaporthe eres TaxID=83184 RepID=A0ABR1P965_DIAER
MGGSMYPDKPYKVYTDWGESLVLPPEFMNEVKSHPDLDFQKVAEDDSHGYIPGWEPFRSGEKIEVREKLNAARQAIEPQIKQRQARKAEAVARGEKPPVYNDSIEWFEQEYTAGYDPAVAQISLSIVAIHTTSDLTLMAMF